MIGSDRLEDAEWTWEVHLGPQAYPLRHCRTGSDPQPQR